MAAARRGPQVAAAVGGIRMSGFEKLIREKAYQLWERAGRPDGRNDEFWHSAKQELEAELAVEEIGRSLDPTAEAPPVAEEKPSPPNGKAAPKRKRTAKAG